MLIEFTRSQNSTVKWRRSPLRSPERGSAAAGVAASSDAPQSPQKRLPAGFCAPHLGQWFSSGAPQSPQNFLPVELSLPQFEQRIGSPRVRVKGLLSLELSSVL